VPETISSRMNSARAANTWNTSRPPGWWCPGTRAARRTGTAAAQVADDRAQVLQAAAEPVQGGHHEGVARGEKVQARGQLGGRSAFLQLGGLSTGGVAGQQRGKNIHRMNLLLQKVILISLMGVRSSQSMPRLFRLDQVDDWLSGPSECFDRFSDADSRMWAHAVCGH